MKKQHSECADVPVVYWMNEWERGKLGRSRPARLALAHMSAAGCVCMTHMLGREPPARTPKGSRARPGRSSQERALRASRVAPGQQGHEQEPYRPRPAFSGTARAQLQARRCLVGHLVARATEPEPARSPRLHHQPRRALRHLPRPVRLYASFSQRGQEIRTQLMRKTPRCPHVSWTGRPSARASFAPPGVDRLLTETWAGFGRAGREQGERAGLSVGSSGRSPPVGPGENEGPG